MILNQVTKLKLSLTTAQIRTGASVPINIGLPASGNGYYYAVRKFDARYNHVDGTNVFDGNVMILYIRASDTYNPEASNSAITLGSSNICKGSPISDIPFNLKENGTLEIIIGSDSTMGEGTVDCYIEVEKIRL